MIQILICISHKSCEHLLHDILIFCKVQLGDYSPAAQMKIVCWLRSVFTSVLSDDGRWGLELRLGRRCSLQSQPFTLLMKIQFCCGRPAKPDRADACGGGLEVHWRLECFSFPLLIDSSNPNSSLAVWRDLFTIDWFDGRKKSLGHWKQRRKSCDSLKGSEWVDDTQTFTEYFMGCSLTETPYCSWLCFTQHFTIDMNFERLHWIWYFLLLSRSIVLSQIFLDR